MDLLPNMLCLFIANRNNPIKTGTTAILLVIGSQWTPDHPGSLMVTITTLN